MNEAWQHAKEIAGLLPKNVQWCFTITDIEEDAVFNIYAPREAWHALRVLLSLGRAEFRFDDTRPGAQSWEEYTIDGLTLSLITPEEQDGADERELADRFDGAADYDGADSDDGDSDAE